MIIDYWVIVFTMSALYSERLSKHYFTSGKQQTMLIGWAVHLYNANNNKGGVIINGSPGEIFAAIWDVDTKFWDLKSNEGRGVLGFKYRRILQLLKC